jgi:nascent polypeptide-associated complex subunit alpha
MFPGMGNPAQMQKMLKQLGIKTDEINARKVTIETDEGNLVLDNPQVTKMTVQGTDTYQVIGNAEFVASNEESKGPSINDEDIKMVAQKAGVSEEKAKEALEEADGDIADAILSLQ